jgi:hypothetical protein
VNCFYSVGSGDWYRKAAEDTTAFGYIACTYLTSISNKHIKQVYQTSISNKHIKQAYQTSISNKHIKQAYQTSIPNGKRDCVRICYSSREHPMGIHLASKYRRSNFAARPGVLVGVPWIATECFGGAVCAPSAWNPSHRASSRGFAVLGWWCAGCISGPAGLMGVRLTGVRLAGAGRRDLDDWLLSVAVACGSFDTGLRGVFDGSGRSGISGSTRRPRDDFAVIQLSLSSPASSVGVGC